MNWPKNWSDSQKVVSVFASLVTGGSTSRRNKRGPSTTEILVAGGVEVRVKSSQDLMHFKSYVIDGNLLRTGSANWSPTGLKRQDNDVHYEMDSETAKLFAARFSQMWDRPTNFVPTIK